MRIGVVCEGVTDFSAIKHFLGAALARHNIDCLFTPLQPHPDHTDDGGWTRVFYWLEEYPSAVRVERFFGGGIFENDLDELAVDALAIHLDADILDDVHFTRQMKKRKLQFSSPIAPLDRYYEIARILYQQAGLEDLCAGDRARHILSPAVESSEAWCIAAFERRGDAPEELKQDLLWHEFGTVLLRSENRPIPEILGEPNKDPDRRERYCSRHSGSRFLELQMPTFALIVQSALAAARI